ncbi:MAG TPA: BON domain-containing protein [Anaerolineae bacterium]|nr:BON domain-containing protein [Anaerolineae bacterium]
MAEATMALSEQDEALETAIIDTLMNYSGVRVWTDALDIQVRGGVVQLGGHVRTQAEKEVTEEVILKVKGVQDLWSNLYVDTDLEIAVAQALGNDPRTRGSFPGILVGSGFGEIFLKGAVASQEIKKAAGEIAAQVPGVREVTNALEAPEPPKPAAPPAAAKPAAGARPAAAAAARPAPKPTPPPEESTEEEPPAEE